MGDISIKGRSPLLKGGRVGFKKGGGYSIKTKKVKPGFDQEFTLPKGTSAAPIKQSMTVGGKTYKHRANYLKAKDKLFEKMNPKFVKKRDKAFEKEMDDKITDRMISMSFKSSRKFGDEVRKTKGTKLTKRGRKK